MSKERYNQIIDEVYENYIQNTPENHVIGSDSDPLKLSMVWKRKNDSSSGYPILERLTQEEFINRIKTNPEFSEKWALNIEERELSLEERYELSGIFGRKEKLPGEPTYTKEQQHSMLDELVPAKLITITYNNEKIESYE